LVYAEKLPWPGRVDTDVDGGRAIGRAVHGGVHLPGRVRAQAALLMVAQVPRYGIWYMAGTLPHPPWLPGTPSVPPTTRVCRTSRCLLPGYARLLLPGYCPSSCP